MKNNSSRAHWLVQSHFFSADKFTCSECGTVVKGRAPAVCPGCGSKMKKGKDDLGWIDELELADIVLEDDF